MINISKFFIIVVLLTFVLTFLGQLLPKRNKDKKKLSPYECGFDPIKPTRLPFSFRFFLIAILFLIFDLEIVLLLPLPIATLLFKLYKRIKFLLLFIIILILGLYYEWINGGLEWAKD